MQTDPEIKLLELTRKKNRITIDELAQNLHTRSEMLAERMEKLAAGKFVNSHEGLLEMDTAQRMRLAERLVHEGRDPQKVSRTLDWKEFEEFAGESLERNGFRTVKHVVFKSRIGRREIDLLAWNDSLLLVIDCKHWLRGLSHSCARHVTQAQVERAEALAERYDLLKKLGVSNPENRLLMPTILSLCEPRRTSGRRSNCRRLKVNQFSIRGLPFRRKPQKYSSQPPDWAVKAHVNLDPRPKH